jgi:hypothetical protein
VMTGCYDATDPPDVHVMSWKRGRWQTLLFDDIAILGRCPLSPRSGHARPRFCRRRRWEWRRCGAAAKV